MRKRILYIIFSLIVFAYSCKEKNSVNILSTKLIGIINPVEFPVPLFIHGITDVCINDSGIIFVDRINSRVIFIKNFIKSGNQPIIIGDKGRGPGEFLVPNSIFITKNNIFISDLASQTISTFDKKGEFKNRINAKVKLNFAVNSKGSIFVPNVDEDYLIREYDLEGNILSNFGEKLNFENNKIRLNHNFSNILVDNADNLYLVFFDYPLIRKYNKNKNLIWEKELFFLNEINNAYQNNITKIEDTPFALFGLLKDVSLDENYLYIYPIAKRKLTHDIMKFNMKTGNFLGYIDLPDSSITVEKIIVNNNNVFGADLDGKLLIFKITK